MWDVFPVQQQLCDDEKEWFWREIVLIFSLFFCVMWAVCVKFTNHFALFDGQLYHKYSCEVVHDSEMDGNKSFAKQWDVGFAKNYIEHQWRSFKSALKRDRKLCVNSALVVWPKGRILKAFAVVLL